MRFQEARGDGMLAEGESKKQWMLKGKFHARGRRHLDRSSFSPSRPLQAAMRNDVPWETQLMHTLTPTTREAFTSETRNESFGRHTYYSDGVADSRVLRRQLAGTAARP